MWNQPQNDTEGVSEIPRHRKQWGLVWLREEIETAGLIEVHPPHEAEKRAYLFLREFEAAVGSAGRKDIDLLQVGVCESPHLLAKPIPLRPAEGWKMGAWRFRSLAACAKPGVGHLLFVLVATPGQGAISYELKVGYRLNPWFYWPMLPVEVVWCLLAGYQHHADIHSGDKAAGTPFKGIFDGIEERAMKRMEAYRPLMLRAVEQALLLVEENSPSVPLVSPPTSVQQASPSPAVKGKRPNSRD